MIILWRYKTTNPSNYLISAKSIKFSKFKKISKKEVGGTSSKRILYLLEDNSIDGARIMLK